MDKLVFNCIFSIFKPSLSYLSHIFICGDKIISVVCFKNQYFMSVKRFVDFFPSISFFSCHWWGKMQRTNRLSLNHKICNLSKTCFAIPIFLSFCPTTFALPIKKTPPQISTYRISSRQISTLRISTHRILNLMKSQKK